MNSLAILDRLQNLLEAELSSLECYRVHAEAIGEDEIAERVRAIIPAEESHAVTLAARIRELGGAPGQASDEAARHGRAMGEESRKQGTLAMLKLELEQEQRAINEYAASVAEILDDMVTLEMLEEQLLDEMRHAKWLKQMISEREGTK